MSRPDNIQLRRLHAIATRVGGRPVADEPATCTVCGQWTQYLDPGYITVTCTDCADRPYGGHA